MSVKKHESGHRTVELEVEVPGTPEQVWQAIATGPGISSWFATSEVEERAGGTVAFHMGAGMDSTGVVTVWEPSHRFAYEERGWAENAPPLATEFTIEARSGGTCTLRLVHSLFASGEEWDDQLEGFELGWPPHFQVLGLYLAHFFAQPVAQFRWMGSFDGSEAQACAALTGALGLAGATVGERRSAPAAAPPLGGLVESTGWSRHPHELVLRLDEPAPGVVILGAWVWGGKTLLMTSFFLFGEQAAAAAKRAEPLWSEWMKERFPSADGAAQVAC